MYPEEGSLSQFVTRKVILKGTSLWFCLLKVTVQGTLSKFVLQKQSLEAPL